MKGNNSQPTLGQLIGGILLFALFLGLIIWGLAIGPQNETIKGVIDIFFGLFWLLIFIALLIIVLLIAVYFIKKSRNEEFGQSYL